MYDAGICNVGSSNDRMRKCIRSYWRSRDCEYNRRHRSGRQQPGYGIWHTVDVEFWYSGGKTAVGVVQEIVDSFNASQSKYHVSTVTQADYDETYQKLQAGIAGNAAPDLVLLNVEAARNLDSKSLLADLQPMIDADSEFQKDN